MCSLTSSCGWPSRPISYQYFKSCHTLSSEKTQSHETPSRCCAAMSLPKWIETTEPPSFNHFAIHSRSPLVGSQLCFRADWRLLFVSSGWWRACAQITGSKVCDKWGSRAQSSTWSPSQQNCLERRSACCCFCPTEWVQCHHHFDAKWCWWCASWSGDSAELCRHHRPSTFPYCCCNP